MRSKAGRSGFALGLVLLAQGGWVRAGEADDLQRMIDIQNAAASNLERLDNKGKAKDETTLLRTWLDEAWKFRAEQEYDKVREVLDRASAQSDMIQLKIDASQAVAAAEEREAAVRRMKAKVEKTRQSINAAQIEKRALEMSTR